MIVYEYPFNERIRTLLRLEDLFEKFTFFLHQESPMQHHAALSTIFEILEVAGRADLKSDLLQELERQKQTLLAYKSNPNVEADALDEILDEVDRVSSALVAAQGKTGQNIRDNEWLMSIRGRTIIPGGSCKFDLPSYYAWQQQPVKVRFDHISSWFAPLMPLFAAITTVLRLLRESGSFVKMTAENGSYQQMLQGKVYQMLQLKITEKLAVTPEISANKYMVWVRYHSQDNDMKSKPFDGDVSFELALCSL